jgi:predicted negative regulator of RcsB-dependent stress response
MPKAIKKKAQKPVVKEEEVTHVLRGATHYLRRQQRLFIPLLAGIIIVALGVAGFSKYHSHVQRKADALEYEAYKIFYGIQQKQPLKKEERYQNALEKFRQAYETRKSAYTLFYIADAQYNLSKYDDAMKTLKELNSEFPDDEKFVPLSYYKMAMIYLQKNDREGALKALDTLYLYRGASFKDLALIETARILDAGGRKEEAVKKYEELVKDYPWSPFIEEVQQKLKEEKK